MYMKISVFHEQDAPEAFLNWHTMLDSLDEIPELLRGAAAKLEANNGQPDYIHTDMGYIPADLYYLLNPDNEVGE